MKIGASAGVVLTADQQAAVDALDEATPLDAVTAFAAVVEYALPAVLTVDQQAAVDALDELTPLASIAAFAAITGDTITTTAIAAGAAVATGAYT